MEHQTHEIPKDQSPVVGQTIVELETVGRAWADHGLRIGAAALQTSALTLAHTANVLVNIATGLKPDKK
jgi:hypothetical protein